MTQRPQTRSRILRIPKKKLLSSTVSTRVIIKDDELQETAFSSPFVEKKESSEEKHESEHPPTKGWDDNIQK